ncbi:MAG: formylglycine-generating enzyme family protein [bacterium]|nr:formylglycine-generating enzyme family protein [bacterium]
MIRSDRAVIGGAEADAAPSFEVDVASFYLSKLPVTNLQYEAFAPDFARSPLSPGDDDPATGIRFGDAQNYCDWYAGVSRKPIRLPTEVEWEFACRAGSGARCFFGAEPDDAEPFVWDARNSGERIPPLRKKKPNAFGLQCMLGGVWEWTSSLYAAYPVVSGDGRDDLDSARDRVLRGGSFRVDRDTLSCSARRRADPDLRAEDVGFRIARSFG